MRALLALLGLLWAGAAQAQVTCSSLNVTPGVAVNVSREDPTKCAAALGTSGAPGTISDNFEGTKATYSAGVTAYAPVATATDIVALCGSASKVVRVLKLDVSGIATAAGTIDVVLIKRGAADTGSTPVVLTAVPHDSADGAASGTMTSYTVSNPTINNTVGTVRSIKQPLAVAGAVGNPQQWSFGINLDRTIVLRGVAQCLAVNMNGAAVPAGAALDIDASWSEE